jgi:toxin YoeB
MRALVFEGNTWEIYEELRRKDQQLHKNLVKILKQMLRDDDPSQGYGKPEKLKHLLKGFYSRRLSAKDRLIYTYDEKKHIYIFAIGGHYEDH